MVGDSHEGVIQGITDTPRKHDIKDLVHRAREHRPDRCCEHSETLEDRPFKGCVLPASLPQMVFDGLDDIVQVRSHSTCQLYCHMPQCNVSCLLALRECG